MKNEVICAVVSVPVEMLRYKYNEAEDFYGAADRYMMTACDMVIAITSDGEEPDALGYARSKGKPIVFIDADTLEVRQ